VVAVTGARRTVLFLVTSFWAYGELTIAIEFARRLAGTSFRPLFLVPPSHRKLIAEAGLAHQTLIPRSGKLNRILLHDIQHVHRPGLVVLADSINFDLCHQHYGLRRADLSVFDCPVGTFDDFSWGRPGAWLDTYGFRADMESDITLDGLAFRLRPCPLNNPLDPRPEPDTHSYSLLGEVDPLPTTARAEVRRKLGVRDGAPVVLVTGAAWQRMHAAYPQVHGFVDACHTMLERLLERLLPHADVLAVGPQLVFHDRAPTGFHPLGPIEPGRFRELIQAVDLHISNNLVSVSMHRLVLGGVPSVLLMSSLHKREGRQWWGSRPQPELTEFAQRLLDKLDEVYPYRMFPVGWYYFLDTLLAGNPFGELLPQVEVFDEEAALAAILPLLDHGPERDALASARETYLAHLRALPEVATVVQALAAR
jgi:hypothetical protein